MIIKRAKKDKKGWKKGEGNEKKYGWKGLKVNKNGKNNIKLKKTEVSPEKSKEKDKEWQKKGRIQSWKSKEIDKKWQKTLKKIKIERKKQKSVLKKESKR